MSLDPRIESTAYWLSQIYGLDADGAVVSQLEEHCRRRDAVLLEWPKHDGISHLRCMLVRLNGAEIMLDYDDVLGEIVAIQPALATGRTA